MSDFYDALVAELDREPTLCACGHPLHAGRCPARWEHDSGGDVCPCEGDGTAEPEPLVLSDEERHLILLIRREQARRDREEAS